MNKPLKYLGIFTLSLSVLAHSSIAVADSGKGKGNGKANSQKEYRYDNGDRDEYRRDDHRNFREDDDKVAIRIDFGDRDIIRDYIRDDYRSNCPPGLAKKRNGCMPPGQAKKYRIGYSLPDDLRWHSIDDDLRRRLDPLPRGYDYVRVDKDILLIGEATKKVIDAVTLISAVEN